MSAVCDRRNQLRARRCRLIQALLDFVMDNEADVFYRELPKVVSHAGVEEKSFKQEYMYLMCDVSYMLTSAVCL